MAVVQTSDTQKEGWARHRVEMGSFAAASGDTSGTITTGLQKVDTFFCTCLKSWSASGGTVTLVLFDPLATVACSWIAIGR
jgi:hypothetical protein